MKAARTAARQDATAIFLAAVHVVAPWLAPAPAHIVGGTAPMPTGEHVWDWAGADPALAPIADALTPDEQERVRAVLDGMVAQLRACAHDRHTS